MLPLLVLYYLLQTHSNNEAYSGCSSSPPPSYEFSKSKRLEDDAGQSQSRERLNECTGRLYYFRNVQNYLTFITIVALCLRQSAIPVPSPVHTLVISFPECWLLLHSSSFVCILLNKNYRTHRR